MSKGGCSYSVHFCWLYGIIARDVTAEVIYGRDEATLLDVVVDAPELLLMIGPLAQRGVEIYSGGSYDQH